MFFEATGSPAPVRRPEPPASGAAPLVAAVVGGPSAVVPVAAACAGELRARGRTAAALVCIWRPAAAGALDPEGPARSPAGATTPGARRVAARLSATGLQATACGRLAWVMLDPDPSAAAGQFRRCRTMMGVPLVLAVAGARPEPFESLLAQLDVCLAVLPADADPGLSELALAQLPARARAVLPPLAPGPPRWAAMAGLARLRSLPELSP
jgi:hypothetical protein